MTPVKCEAAGISASVFSAVLGYIDVSQMLAIGTFSLGFLTWLYGRRERIKDRALKDKEDARREALAALDEQIKRAQIEREQIAIATQKAELSGFIKRTRNTQ